MDNDESQKIVLSSELRNTEGRSYVFLMVMSFLFIGITIKFPVSVFGSPYLRPPMWNVFDDEVEFDLI